MTLLAETKLSLFYYVIGSNWVKMKKLEGDKVEPKTWAKVIQTCDEYRKTFCPELSFDDLVKIMKDIHVLAKDQSDLFRTMNKNFSPLDMPLLDLEKYMKTIYDTQGIEDYVKYYKMFFDQLDSFVKFLNKAENLTSNNP